MRVSSLQEAYPEIGRRLLYEGAVSRNERTDSRIREVVGYSLHIEDATRSLPVGCGRNLAPAVGVIEALQLVGGWSDPELQCRTSPNMRQFTDVGVFHGAYGLRVANQLPLLLDRLRSDHTSRQAVLTIWDPQRDAWDGPKDLPCTVTLQFLIREDKLQCMAYMRSNDFWWGLAYDVFQFTQLQMTLATVLGIETGAYHHFAGSFHTYERDWESIEGLKEYDGRPHPPTVGFGIPKAPWRHVQNLTRYIVTSDVVLTYQLHTTSHVWRWYVETMAPYVT